MRMKTPVKIIYWFPRVLCILAILFVSLFALDAFSSDESFWGQIGDFLVHLIPSFILTAVLILAWKRELIGGIIFIIIGVGLSPSIFLGNYHMNHSIWISSSIILMITFPFAVTGILFLLSNKLRKEKKPEIKEPEPEEQQTTEL